MTKVVFTQPAEYDLTDIEYYIFFEFVCLDVKIKSASRMFDT